MSAQLASFGTTDEGFSAPKSYVAFGTFAGFDPMVLEHCSTMTAGELSSFAIEANADAMQALAEAGLIKTFDQTDGRIRATVLPAAEKLIAGFLADKHAAR